MTTHSNVNANYFHKKGIAKVFQFSSDAGMMENFAFGRSRAGAPRIRGLFATYHCGCKHCFTLSSHFGRFHDQIYTVQSTPPFKLQLAGVHYQYRYTYKLALEITDSILSKYCYYCDLINTWARACVEIKIEWRQSLTPCNSVNLGLFSKFY